jgi:hypothetical protein
MTSDDRIVNRLPIETHATSLAMLLKEDRPRETLVTTSVCDNPTSRRSFALDLTDAIASMFEERPVILCTVCAGIAALHDRHEIRQSCYVDETLDRHPKNELVILSQKLRAA